MEQQSFETSPQERKERQLKEFHFEEIGEIEPAVISLVEQMKEKIDRGEYDTLLSDDVGGRIPTLIFRKIIKERNPHKKLKTSFIASGQTYIPRSSEDEDNYTELKDHLKRATKDSQNALLVTQFIHHGNTLANLSRAVRDAGLKNFDIVALTATFENEAREKIGPELEGGRIYTGGYNHHTIHEEHEHLSGVRKIKKKKYSPYPHKAVKVISEEGRELSMDEWRKIFDIRKGEPYPEWLAKTKDPEKIAEFDRRTYEELTEEEKADIQRNINLAREDVRLLAERVIEKVWGEKN